MGVPCVRVDREAGEETRKRLADADLVADGHDIVVEDGLLYIPITDPAAVPDDLAVVEYGAPVRESQTMPADRLEFEPSYERIGEVIVIDEDDPDRTRAIADAIVASDLPVRTVLNRASKIKGETRVRDWEVLAQLDEDTEGGRRPTEVVHREYGCEFLLDLAEVYFSPRLATERHRVVEQVGAWSDDGSEGRPDSHDQQSPEHVLDMFAGVGPFAIPIAKRGATVVGVDINPTAVGYLRENTKRNDVEDRVTAIEGDVREVAADYEGWADRILMNLPHSADEFLDAAATIAGDDCVLHYYDIQHEDDPYGPGERAIRDAFDPQHHVTVETRHTVRSYAPHELNVVLDVRVTG
jgi:tRNA (guanine37-N1)-methyltransferase